MPTLSLAELLRLQRRVIFEIGDADSGSTLIICDHPPCVSIGRDGSRADVRGGRVPVRWVARGGGTLLHTPGQVSTHLITSLPALDLTPAAFRDRLQSVVAGVIATYGVESRTESLPGLFLGARQIAHVGIAIRAGVTAFGITLNVNPDLELFHSVRVDGRDLPMTSIARESPLRVRLPTVRQQLAEAIAISFGFRGLAVFHHHPALLQR